MLDSKLNIKLIDFGLSNRILDRENLNKDDAGDIHQLKTFAGTPQFQAPEIFEKKKYDGQKSDIFAIGVILYMIVIKSYPFKAASKSDKYYKYIYQNTPESFNKYWDLMHQRSSKADPSTPKCSIEFKQLIFKLLAYNAGQRISLARLKKDPWLKWADPDFSISRTRKALGRGYLDVIEQK